MSKIDANKYVCEFCIRVSLYLSVQVDVSQCVSVFMSLSAFPCEGIGVILQNCLSTDPAEPCDN